ncbi:ESCRT-II complex, vps25 subunit [Delitschia confertaspora ATCC 74209]|uniref:Vacuolar protein-sorting-associated protein 25 n=1 Tax=Delitschia confertaspora ATCC 74209 TaxID=1513339 RepID=A0A9P4JH08_9PLEO|nr:ESCRT-II complex, vps25 subunit [Delitschia confertaspora ATCC 74209]
MASLTPSSTASTSNLSTASILQPSTKEPSTTTPPSSSTDPTGFSFPPHYSFPPFFTLQPTLSTRQSQLSSWSTLLQSYCRHLHIFTLSLLDALETPLFYNRTLSRRLSLRDARAVVDYMCSEEGGHRAEWILASQSNSSKKGSKPASDDEKTKLYIFWRRPEEWATVIEDWVDGTGQRGTVLTLYELAESDVTKKEEFHGMEEELLRRCLGVCVKRGKAQIFGAEGEMGVKFF